MLGIVLLGDDPDAVRRAGGGAERAADALLESGVLEAVQLVAAAEALVDRGLLLRVLDRHRALEHPAEGGAQAAEGLAEGAVCAAGAARLRAALDRDHVLMALQIGELRPVRLVGVELGLHQLTVTITAVTRTFRVASGSITFQPSDMSWS